MSGRVEKQLPGTASFGRGCPHRIYPLLISLVFLMGTSNVVNALVPSGFYLADEPALSTCRKMSVSSDANFAESVFTVESELDIRPGLVWMRQPSYPEKAMSMAIEGRVLLHVLVGETGRAKEVKIIEEFPNGAGFGQCCLAVAQKAVYFPGIKDNKPVKGWVEIPIEFKLP